MRPAMAVVLVLVAYVLVTASVCHAESHSSSSSASSPSGVPSSVQFVHPKLHRTHVGPVNFSHGQFVVVFSDSATSNDMERAFFEGMKNVDSFHDRVVVDRSFQDAIKAYVITIVVDETDEEPQIQGQARRKLSLQERHRRRLETEYQLLRGLLEEPKVAFIEEAQDVYPMATNQSVPQNWGLDRIDQTSLPLNGVYSYRQSGDDVSVYIIDTGIRATHTEFNDRVECGFDYYDSNCQDARGHGTFVAGIVGGKTVGIAKNVSLISVKIFPDTVGGGSILAALAGIDYVVRESKKNTEKLIVANLSLQTATPSSAVDRAVRAYPNIVWVVAAGNENIDACDVSPARVPTVLTVGAIQDDDNRVDFSNRGECVDIFAPGSEIRTTSNCDDDCFTGLSGTSLSSPHAAGVAALYAEAYPNANSTEIMQMIVDDASPNVLNNTGVGSPNLLLSTVSLLHFDEMDPTVDPTAEPTSNPTSDPTRDPTTVPTRSKVPLSAGDVAIVQYNSDGIDDFAFVVLEDILAGSEIFFTDNGWLKDGGFRDDEGILQWTATSTIDAGSVVTIVPSNESASAGTAINFDGIIDFSGGGDQLFAYQNMSSSSSSSMPSSSSSSSTINLLFAMNNQKKGWQRNAKSKTSSADPKILPSFAKMAVIEVDNTAYNRKTTGSRDELLVSITDPTNWIGQNRERLKAVGPFHVLPEPPSKPPSTASSPPPTMHPTFL